MPYYDFACNKDHITELRMSFDEYANLPKEKELEYIECPECASLLEDDCQYCSPYNNAYRIFTRPATGQMNYLNGQRH